MVSQPRQESIHQAQLTKKLDVFGKVIPGMSHSVESGKLNPTVSK